MFRGRLQGVEWEGRGVKTSVAVELGARAYEVVIGTGWDRLGERVRYRVRGDFALLVTDENVAKHHAESVTEALRRAGFSVVPAVLPPGEETKTLPWAAHLYDLLVDAQADRGAVVVALGGGVISDLAGFVAATYARGVPFMIAPTSLLAMVDASVGGKVAVDHPRAKNGIGAFHQPSLVWCNLDVLDTLPDRQFHCGLAEAVKHGAILDEAYFCQTEQNAERILQREPAAVAELVAQSCRIKAKVVRQDEFETLGLRSALNFGHTFGHALEIAGQYRELNHGEAVSIGMNCAARLAERLGRVDAAYTKRLQDLLVRFHLPTEIPRRFLEHDLVKLMRGDKKAKRRSIRFVLPVRLGEVELVSGVDEKIVDQTLKECAATV